MIYSDVKYDNEGYWINIVNDNDFSRIKLIITLVCKALCKSIWRPFRIIFDAEPESYIEIFPLDPFFEM